MTAPAKILLAEDDAALRDGLCALLASEGYAVRAVANGTDVLAQCRAKRPDLLLLDVMMPGLGGYAVCREIRRTDASLPVVFLTVRDQPTDEMRGFSLGADDYIAKTAPESLILARIAAVLRRSRHAPAAEETAAFAFGDVRIDAASLLATHPDGHAESLTLREAETLRLLAGQPGSLVFRDALIARFWSVDFPGDERSLDQFVCRLRAKLGPAARCLETVRGVGYRYRP